MKRKTLESTGARDAWSIPMPSNPKYDVYRQRYTVEFNNWVKTWEPKGDWSLKTALTDGFDAVLLPVCAELRVRLSLKASERKKCWVDNMELCVLRWNKKEMVLASKTPGLGEVFSPDLVDMVFLKVWTAFGLISIPLHEMVQLDLRLCENVGHSNLVEQYAGWIALIAWKLRPYSVYLEAFVPSNLNELVKNNEGVLKIVAAEVSTRASRYASYIATALKGMPKRWLAVLQQFFLESRGTAVGFIEFEEDELEEILVCVNAKLKDPKRVQTLARSHVAWAAVFEHYLCLPALRSAAYMVVGGRQVVWFREEDKPVSLGTMGGASGKAFARIAERDDHGNVIMVDQRAKTKVVFLRQPRTNS